MSRAPVDRSGFWVPRDLVDEIDAELVDARRRMTRDGARVRALEELLELTRRLALELGRSATLVDLFATASTVSERQRRQRLVRALRRQTDG